MAKNMPESFDDLLFKSILKVFYLFKVKFQYDND